MDFLLTDTKKLYFKFLFPSMMSALVTSIYFFVDAIAVGRSEGALGTAAMAVTSPTYGIMAFLAVLCGGRRLCHDEHGKRKRRGGKR